nr:hypothetical protein [uncultured Propionibacterium sp.]
MAEWGIVLRAATGRGRGSSDAGPPGSALRREVDMGKTGRKRRARRKNGANHGKRPNA